MRIIIIDDSKSIQKSVSWKIAKLGAEVVGTASDGVEGLALYDKLRPDLTLLDITMPNMDGRECLKKILELDPAAKVAMLSAVGSPEVASECLERGALTFLDKNLMLVEDYLEKEIQKLLNTLGQRAA